MTPLLFLEIFYVNVPILMYVFRRLNVKVFMRNVCVVYSSVFPGDFTFLNNNNNNNNKTTIYMAQ